MPIESLLPSVVSLGCRGTSPNEIWSWHRHEYDELCFFGDDTTRVGHAGVQYDAPPNSLFLFRGGEAHGFWNGEKESPELWAIHFRADDLFYKALPGLNRIEPNARVWQLEDQEIAFLKDLFSKISLEVALGRTGWEAAASAWLQVMLCSVQRLPEPANAAIAMSDGLDTELLNSGKPYGSAQGPLWMK